MITRRHPLSTHAALLIALWAASSGCVDCEPCEKYSFALFTAEQTFEPGLYRVEVTFDEMTVLCEVDTAATSEAVCGNDQVELKVYDDVVDLFLPTTMPEYIEVQAEQLETGIRWIGMAAVEDRLSPGESGCDACAYGYGNAVLTLEN